MELSLYVLNATHYALQRQILIDQIFTNNKLNLNFVYNECWNNVGINIEFNAITIKIHSLLILISMSHRYWLWKSSRYG